MTHRRRTQEGAPHGTFHPAYSQKETHREGWTLAWTCYPDGSETVEIRCFDAGSPFADDEGARHHVVARARAGPCTGPRSIRATRPSASRCARSAATGRPKRRRTEATALRPNGPMRPRGRGCRTERAG